MYHTVSVRFASTTLLAGGSLAILSRFHAATALDTLRRHRPTTAFLVPTHLHRILQDPGPRPRRAVRLAAPPGPRRGALSRHGQARHHGTSPARRRLGVLRLHRGPVLGVRTGGLARAPRHRRPGPSGPATPHRAIAAGTDPDAEEVGAGHHLVRHARLRPLQLLGEPRGHGGRLERRRPAPSATSAASIRTASST